MHERNQLELGRRTYEKDRYACEGDEMSERKEIEKLIREYVLLEFEESPQRKSTDVNQLADDSVDSAMDRSIASFDKSAKDKDGQLQIDKFVSDIAIMIDHVQEHIDLKGIVVRRIANYLTKSYDEKVSKEVLRMLQDGFGISSNPSYHQDFVDDREVPVAKNGGPDAAGGSA